MRTPETLSPYSLLQEHYRHDTWKMLVACIMLNKTSAVQVKKIIDEFFLLWPSAASCSKAKLNDIIDVIRPLGLYNRRATTLQNFSRAFSDTDWKSVGDLPGIGKYAHDSYKMFVEGNLVEDIEDKELKNYLYWALSLYEEENRI